MYLCIALMNCKQAILTDFHIDITTYEWLGIKVPYMLREKPSAL